MANNRENMGQSAQEKGRKGGAETAARYGDEYMVDIGQEGGEASNRDNREGQQGGKKSSGNKKDSR